MKKIIVLFFCFVCFLAILSAEEKEVIQKATELFDQQKYTDALKIIEEGIREFGPTDKLINTKYKILLLSKKYKEALETFEIIIQRVGESPHVMIDKIRLLYYLQRYNQALETALNIDDKSSEKSPFISLFIVRIAVAQKNKDMAIDWLEKSLERGEYSYNYLLQEEFAILHEEKRFKDIILKMKDKIGIDRPAKDFSVSLLSGGTYYLSAEKGKVVLIDFWATWCPPCVAEFPNLKKLYKELHSKGFEIIGISLDSNRELLEKFTKQRGIPWNIAFSGKAMEGEVVKLYGVQSVPMYWLVDRKGILRFSFDTGGKELENPIKQVVNE